MSDDTYILCDILPGKRLVVEHVSDDPADCVRASVKDSWIAPQQATLITDGYVPKIGERYMPYRHLGDDIRVYESPVDLGLPQIEHGQAIDLVTLSRPTPWMPAPELAKALGVRVDRIYRQGRMKSECCEIEKRPATGEHREKGYRKVFRIVPDVAARHDKKRRAMSKREAFLSRAEREKVMLARQPIIERAATERERTKNLARFKAPTIWMLSGELAHVLGVEADNINAACRKDWKVHGLWRIERRKVTEVERWGAGAYMYRAVRDK